MIDAIEILTHVNDYYDQAFSRLTTYVFSLLAFVGVIVPAFMNYWQNRQFKRDHAAHVAHINAQIDAATAKLKIALDDRVAEESVSSAGSTLRRKSIASTDSRPSS